VRLSGVVLACVVGLSSSAVLMAQTKPLSLDTVSLNQYDGGPAVTENYVWRPGEILSLTFLISNYKGGAGEKLDLTYEIDALDPNNIKLMPTVTGTVNAELAPEDKEWRPKVRGTVPLPPLADTGDYRLIITARDKLAGTEARKEIPFHVRGRSVEPSDQLVVRNFRFLKTEEDKDPLTAANYRPGDAVWARFDITGYKLAEKNRVDVEYGLAVLKPTGETIYTVPNAAEERSESFYPKRYVLGVLNLNTRPDTKPGEYTVLLTVKDNVSGQTNESRHAFRVE